LKVLSQALNLFTAFTSLMEGKTLPSW